MTAAELTANIPEIAEALDTWARQHRHPDETIVETGTTTYTPRDVAREYHNGNPFIRSFVNRGLEHATLNEIVTSLTR